MSRDAFLARMAMVSLSLEYLNDRLSSVIVCLIPEVYVIHHDSLQIVYTH